MMHKTSVFAVIAVHTFLVTGCMTFSGEQLPSLESIKSQVTPSIETSVSPDYQYNIDVLQVITSNKDGRLVNDRVIEIPWKDKDYISDATYVKLEEFTGEADYNLTLSGSHVVDSSIAGQIISGLTLWIIPFTVDQEYNLLYKLEHVKIGQVYTVNAYQTESMVGWLPYIIAFPFSLLGSIHAMDDLSEYVYQEFVKQGAFQVESNDRVNVPTSEVKEAKPTTSTELLAPASSSLDHLQSQATEVSQIAVDHSLPKEKQIEIPEMPKPVKSVPNPAPLISESPVELPETPITIEPNDSDLTECIEKWRQSAWYSINRQRALSESLVNVQEDKLKTLEQKIRQTCEQEKQE